MIMDHDIAMDDYAALKLREGASLLPQEPDSHEDQRGDGQGPPASPVARLPQRERLPNRRGGYTQKARVAVRRSTSEQEIMPMVASARFIDCISRARPSGR